MYDGKSETFRTLVSIRGSLFHYDPEAPGCIGSYAEEDTQARQRGLRLSPWATVLTRLQARFKARAEGEGEGWDDEEWGRVSSLIDMVEGMALGETAVWDGPDGEPVVVERSEDPDGPYWMLSGGGTALCAVDVLRSLGAIALG
jgi:hypothetical protein